MKDNSRIVLINQLLALAAPIALASMVQTGYQLINAFWVGRVSPDAVAVVTLCFPVNLLMISLGSGLSLGGSILIAQRFGAKDHQQVNHLTEQTLSAIILLAIVITILGLFASPWIVQLLGAHERIQQSTTIYLQITFIGTLFSFLSMGYQSILRSLGEAKAPLLIIIPGLVISALLNPLMIFGWGLFPEMGVEGAAWATVVTQVFTSVAGIYLMLLPRYRLTIKFRKLWPHIPSLKTLVKLGLPAAVEQSMGALTVSVMTVLAATFGTLALASYGIVFRIMMFTTIPGFGLSMAASILLGQSLGAGEFRKTDRIAIEASILGFILMGALGVFLFVAAEPVSRFFVPNDPELVEHCVVVLRIFSLFFPFSGIQMALTGVFRGAGDTFAAMLISLCGSWVLQVPLSIVLAKFTTLADLGLWWGMVIAAAINVLIVIGYFKTHRWKRKINMGI